MTSKLADKDASGGVQDLRSDLVTRKIGDYLGEKASKGELIVANYYCFPTVLGVDRGYFGIRPCSHPA